MHLRTAAHDHRLTDADAHLAKTIVSGLHRPDARRYWVDMTVSALLGWTAFAVACSLPPWSLSMGAAGIVAWLALYRAMAFLHELSHQTESALPGFALAWNVLAGVPLLFPSIVHVGVHANHHKSGTYGTDQDPEYYQHGSSIGAAVGFVALNSLMPVLCAIRFLLLAPIGLLSSRARRVLETHATSLSMNPTYRREYSDHDRALVVKTELAILLFWGGLLALAAQGMLPWRAFVHWAVIVGAAHGVNAVRTLGAHRYCNDGQPLDRAGQLLDSIDTPGGPWTELWAPVGLRYHALHHLFPGIPYHTLGTAHRRLIDALPADSPYRAATSRSLLASLRTLLFDSCRSVQLR